MECPPLKGERVVKKIGEDPFKYAVVTEWHKYFLENWFSYKKIAFLLPCTSIKPYNRSATHKLAYSIAKDVDYIQFYSVSEPMLLVPKEYENCYPFNSYDYPPSMMTKEEKEEFITLLSKALIHISHMHERIVAVLPKHHLEIAQKASEISGVKIEFHPYGRLAFKTISSVLKEIITYNGNSTNLEKISSTT
ncbi:hypothetical protein DFR86_02190 [Acidianus sulfidivorans JP7]|uniref:DUF5591 domain-containing protein n=1 Tax=Acidianus sulfidivorans JP7 TaxID=619593 RepID=A0A2U9IKH2_9CREN|nr:DUF5591 domain-containing protein [Acidianus sulfidivorans]AWR96476.1 hypothetical protein DFR86_02190 [Acidianus sulfidivorans JP7]